MYTRRGLARGIVIMLLAVVWGAGLLLLCLLGGILYGLYMHSIGIEWNASIRYLFPPIYVTVLIGEIFVRKHSQLVVLALNDKINWPF